MERDGRGAGEGQGALGEEWGRTGEERKDGHMRIGREGKNAGRKDRREGRGKKGRKTGK